MALQRFFLTLFSRALILVIVGLLPCFNPAQARRAEKAQTGGPSAQASTQVEDKFFYLPMIFKPSIPFTGTVTYQGNLAAGVTLNLFLHKNGITKDEVYADATTNADGTYTFATPPALDTGDYYYVSYTHHQLGALLYFQCKNVTKLTTKYTCNIDITDIALTDPANGAKVGLPYTFRWVKRADTSESYAWYLYQKVGDQYEVIVYTLPLGYVDLFLNRRFSRGVVGVTYYWSIVVSSAEGTGQAGVYNAVIFSSVGY